MVLQRPSHALLSAPENRARDLFVGREWVWSELTAAAARAEAARGSTYVISGEPGVGKTRLMVEFARACPGGFRVFSSLSSDIEGTPALWPWIQILREMLDSAHLQRIRVALGARSDDVLGLVRECCEGFLGRGPVFDEDSWFPRFDAIASFLRAFARETPTLLSLDDLHRADRASLLLFEFLGREIANVPMLLLGSSRNSDPESRLSLGRITRNGPMLEIELGPLSDAAIETIVEAHHPGAPSRSDLREITYLSGGNPLFASELAGWEAHTPLPRAIRRSVEERFGGFGSELTELLEVAAVIGPEFDSESLAVVSGCSKEDVMIFMDEAIAATVISDAGGIPGSYAFRAPVIARVLYEGMGASKQLNHHRTIASHLERSANQTAAVISNLARHYAQMARYTDPEKAVDFAFRAGRNAIRVRDYRGAASHLRNAIDALELIPASDAIYQTALLIELGRVHSRAGLRREARDAYDDAALLAAREELFESFAFAVLGLARLPSDERYANRALIEKIRAALRNVDDEGPVRALLLAQLIFELARDPEQKIEESAQSEALELAIQSGDPSAHGFALLARLASGSTRHDVEERLNLSSQIVALANETGEDSLEVEGRLQRLSAGLAAGEGAVVDAEVEGLIAASNHWGEPHHRAIGLRAKSLIALIEGRFETADSLAHRAYELSQEWDPIGAQESFVRQMLVLRAETADLESIEPMLREVFDATSRAPIWRCELAHLEYLLHRSESARVQFERLAHYGFAKILSQPHGLVALCRMAEICVALGDTTRAQELGALLRPYWDVNAEVGAAGVWYGSVSYYAGRLAELTGARDDARECYAFAHAMAVRLGARAWMARVECVQSELLAATGNGAAEPLQDRVRRSAEELGMERLLGQLAEPEQATAEVSPVVRTGSFMRSGDHWEIAYGGEPFRLRDQIGLRHIAALLSRPGREVHTLELFIAVRGAPPTPGASKKRAAGLEANVRERYAEKIEALEADLEEAREFRDTGRVTVLEAKREEISREIAAALGTDTSNAQDVTVERARVSVTRTIKAALTKLTKADAALGAHLQATIRKGTYLSYNPDPRVPVAWSIEIDGEAVS